MSVVSYHAGISGYATPPFYRTQTGGRSVTVRGNEVELDDGRTIAIPRWCDEVQITVRGGKVSVTFPEP